ncbi:MAG TPA: Calx-beta domain-containing protein [Verrucomicrobiae bacterium]
MWRSLAFLFALCAVADVRVVFCAEGSGGGVIDTQLDPPIFTLPPEPWTVDEGFQFGETNITVINDIELFPDERIAYGGIGRFDTLGQADRNGAVVNTDTAGWNVTNVTSLTVDADDRVIYSVGLPGGWVQRSTTWDDIGWSSQSAVRGTPSKVYRLDERALLVAGSLTVVGDTNRYGLVRLDLSGKVDESFAYTNLIDLNIDTAVVLADGSVIATYPRTNGNLTWSEVGRWRRDGTRDVSYDAFALWASSFGTNSQVTAMAKAPGTNGFVAAVRTEPVSGSGVYFSRLIAFNEAGIPSIWFAESPYIAGTVHAIGFEVVNATTATNGGYDRVIAAGEFTMFEDLPCINLVSVNLDETVAWYFPTNAGPDGPIHDVAVQLDGKVLIAGAFTNVNGIEAKGMARVRGSSATNGATYLYWADSRFTDFENGLQNHSSPITMRRSGNLDQSLTVFLSDDPREGQLVNIPWAVEFEAGKAEASAGVGILNNLQRNGRERFEITASVTNANLVMTRSTTEFVVLDDETPGTLDPWYDIPYQLGRNTFGIQPDGKIIFGGYGTTLERYNPDGTHDETFVTNGLPTGSGVGNLGIWQIFPQFDGSIYIAGLFNTTNGLGINHVARLNADGTLDTRFNPGLRNFATQRYVKMLPLENGDVLIWVVTGAQPLTYLEGIFRLDERGNIIRVYQGSRPWSNEPIMAITEAEELFTYSGFLPRALTKYTATGAVATNFPTVDIATVRAMHARNSGLLLGGNFTNIASVAVTNIARLDAQTGAVDTNFPTIVNGAVYLIRESEGKLYISGDFTKVNGQPRNRLARLNVDGSLDETFDPGLGPNRAAQQLSVQIDGSLMIGTAFDRVDGVNTEPIVRIHGDIKQGEIRFVSRRIELSETNHFVNIELERVGGSAGDLSITLSTVEGSALEGQQFGGTNVTLSFADGEFGRKSIRIPLFADNELTGNRTFSVVASSIYGSEEATVVLRDGNSPLLGSASVGTATNAVRDMAFDSQNGWLYIVGNFTNVNDAAITNLVRLNPSLQADESFRLSEFPAYATTSTTNFFEPIESVAVRDNGIAIGGRFNRVGTNLWANVIRVRNDGSFETEFNAAVRAAVSGAQFVRHILYEPDGQLVASVQTSVGSIRYNPNGTRDDFFVGDIGFGSDLRLDAKGRFYDLIMPGSVRRADTFGNQDGFRILVSYNLTLGRPTGRLLDTIAIQPDGKVLVGGVFTHAVDTSGPAPSAPRFVRVLTNGLRDTNFVAVVGTNTSASIKNSVSVIQPLADGSILLGGRFEVVNGERRSMLALVDTNGNLRSDFKVEVVGETIDQFALLPDGDVIVRGNVSSVDGVPVGNVFKLALPDVQPPVARFLWPTNGAEVRVSDVPDEIRMHVFDPDGYIERVVLELDGQPIATNSSGNVPFFAFLPASGEHTLRVTATDASGLSTTETVTFRTATVVMEPSVIVQRSGGEVLITYQAARLQESADLENWTDAHAGGGEFRPAATESHRFYRAAGP